jgi:hypothetical protein
VTASIGGAVVIPVVILVPVGAAAAAATHRLLGHFGRGPRRHPPATRGRLVVVVLHHGVEGEKARTSDMLQMTSLVKFTFFGNHLQKSTDDC